MVEMAAKAGTLQVVEQEAQYLPALGAGFSAFAVENKPRRPQKQFLNPNKPYILQLQP